MTYLGQIQYESQLPMHAASDERKGLHCTETHLIAMWNVRGMSQGKLDIVKQEMVQLEINLFGIN